MTMVGSLIIIERNVENGATTARISSGSDYAYSIIRYEGAFYNGIQQKRGNIISQKNIKIIKSFLNKNIS
jgi:hypothetical protein